MHNSHYNPQFWVVPADEQECTALEQIDRAMLRAKQFVVEQYQSTLDYMLSLGVNKPLHIGETGWATVCVEDYGADGSRAADEYKSGLYYQHMRDWSKENNIACFYFEAFDECWKDQNNSSGSENHFGLINLKGEAKYAAWDLHDKGAFEGLTRDGQIISKTFNGERKALMEQVLAPPYHY
jgi:hypothetical protein